MKVTAPKTRIKLAASKLYEWVSNFENFSHYLSDQVTDISTTADSCSFTIENITRVTLKIAEKIPFSKINFVADNDKNIPLFITLYFISVLENETEMEIDLDIEIPLFLKPILQKSLFRFVETLSEKIKIQAENNIL